MMSHTYLAVRCSLLLTAITILALVLSVDVAHADSKQVSVEKNEDSLTTEERLTMPETLLHDELHDESIEVRTYTTAKPVKKNNPRYPRGAQRKGVEGWVVVNYMIDPEGNTYEVEATAYAGDQSFVKAAKVAASRYKYTPAHIDDMPIHSGAVSKIIFQMAGDRVGARPAFIRKYRAFFEQLESGEAAEQLNEAYSALADFGVSYLYEDALLAVAQSAYADHLGDYVNASRNLAHALQYQDKFNVFKTNQFKELQKQLFWAQVRAGSLADALETWTVIEPEVHEHEDFEAFQKTIANINSLQAQGKDFSANGTVYDHYRYSRKLLASAFSFNDVEGDLAESKLYCDQGFLGFAIEPNVRYNIRDDYENCNLVVIGDPGTTFTITEHWSEVGRNS